MSDPDPIVREVGVIIIEGAQGQPCVIAADIGGGQIVAEVAKPDTAVEFNRILQSLGIDRCVVVEDMSKMLVPMDKHHEMPTLFGEP